jgi:Protein of unknown function (DUF3800)
MKHRLYIDEVGNPDFESCHDHNHRFLSLTGVILDIEHVQNAVHPQMEKLKKEFFDHHPDEPLIFHRKDIVNAKPPFQALQDINIKQNFDHAFLGLLKEWDYTVITVCIDKLSHHEKYAEWRFEPYHYCLEILLERYLYFLDTMETVGDAMAESRGGKEDRELKKVYSRLWEMGGQFVSPNRFQSRFTSKQLKIKAKTNNISGLQLADLIAHPSRNEILLERGILDKPLAPFAQEIIKILQGKYYVHKGNVYGKKFL